MSTPTPPRVVVKDLIIKYGDKTAVNLISFSVQPGESLGILGSNGAGKSSTMKVISGVNPSRHGSILIDNLNLADIESREQALTEIGYCPDVGGLIKTATVREHIAITLAAHQQLERWDQALRLVERMGLINELDEQTAGFSHGMSRRLSVILAVIASNKVLILDEPFDGVDPSGVEETLGLIEDAKAAGLSVIISTHLQELLVKASDRVIIMKDGEIVEEGSSQRYEGDKGKKRYRNIILGLEQDDEEEDVETVAVDAPKKKSFLRTIIGSLFRFVIKRLGRSNNS